MQVASLGKIEENLKKYEESIGLEFHPFCIGWYNDRVSGNFKLDYPKDTLAFCVISTPSFFEKSFLPFVKNHEFCMNDPFDQCMISNYQNIKEDFDAAIDVIHDFELHSNRRPKILTQTAGHVSGSAFYYQRKDVVDENSRWNGKKVFGVSNHPKYGGWFGFRGALIFKNHSASFLEYKEPEDLLSNEKKIELLEKFNFSWQDWTFRDVANESGERYSDLQKQYFRCKPSERKELLNDFFLEKS
ncbi:cyanocobalamin reductase / alkylcobalamin dealkylase-like [Clytia hemisphaerica]|uniref:cyanocobalamin reductase / alkylcobalamin dealkylase-like n=1 Tax=Clytia hemisphaerica TaxID=252671 RepID=UPI0034D6930D